MPISGDKIRSSLFASVMTGDEGKKIIMTSLESKGMILDGGHYYSFSEIETHFKNLFGERLAAVIFAEVKAHLTKRDQTND